MRPPFPAVIDSTMLSAFRACPTRFRRQYLEHWKPIGESVHLIAGGAFAKGLEAARESFYVRKEPKDIAEGAGVAALIKDYGDYEPEAGHAKSLDRMIGALVSYFDQYPFGQDNAVPISRGGSHGIEFSFCEPLEIAHPETGEPILFTGRADMVVHYADGLYLLDDKTTSQLGATWPLQWDMRSQFTAYTWAARRVVIPVRGTIVRGVAIRKTGYDHAECLTTRADFELDRWHDQTHRDIARMIQSWQSGDWDYNLDHSCNDYGGCALRRICKQRNPETWLPVYFERRVWNPLLREEQAIANSPLAASA